MLSDRSQSELSVCQRDLELVNRHNDFLLNGFCKLALMIKKYEDMDLVGDDKAVLGEVRWILERVSEAQA